MAQESTCGTRAGNADAARAQVDDELEAVLRERLHQEGMMDMWNLGMHVYLTCDAMKDFVMTLDDVWEAVGFSSKEDAKVLLVEHGIPTMTGWSSPRGRNRPRETVVLTVHGFKRMCKLAGTNCSERVADYFQTMEYAMLAHVVVKLREQQRVAEKAMADLENLQGKKYEEVPRDEYVYICKEVAQDGTKVHKIGRTMNVNKREKQYKTGSAHGCFIIYQRATHNSKLVEAFVKVVLHRYHLVGYGGGAEHYECDEAHIKDVMDLGGIVVDTCASSRECIPFEELWQLIVKRVEEERGVSVPEVRLASEPRYAHVVEPPVDKVHGPTASEYSLARKHICDAVEGLRGKDVEAYLMTIPGGLIRQADRVRIAKNRETLDLVDVFIKERCVVDKMAKECVIASLELLDAFNAWVTEVTEVTEEESGTEEGSGEKRRWWRSKELVKAMRLRGFVKKLVRLRGSAGACQCYVGVRLAQ
jgi:hypothetical protein